MMRMEPYHPYFQLEQPFLHPVGQYPKLRLHVRGLDFVQILIPANQELAKELIDANDSKAPQPKLGRLNHLHFDDL